MAEKLESMVHKLIEKIFKKAKEKDCSIFNKILPNDILFIITCKSEKDIKKEIGKEIKEKIIQYSFLFNFYSRVLYEIEIRRGYTYAYDKSLEDTILSEEYYYFDPYGNRKNFEIKIYYSISPKIKKKYKIKKYALNSISGTFYGISLFGLFSGIFPTNVFTISLSLISGLALYGNLHLFKSWKKILKDREREVARYILKKLENKAYRRKTLEDTLKEILYELGEPVGIDNKDRKQKEDEYII